MYILLFEKYNNIHLVLEAHLATLQVQNKLNVLATAPPTEQPSQLAFKASSSGNRHKQSNKKFCNYCKRLGHTIEACYCRKKSIAAIANTESTPPMWLGPSLLDPLLTSPSLNYRTS